MSLPLLILALTTGTTGAQTVGLINTNPIGSTAVGSTAKSQLTTNAWVGLLVQPDAASGFQLKSLNFSAGVSSGYGSANTYCELWTANATTLKPVSVVAGITPNFIAVTSTKGFFTCTFPATATIPQASAPGAASAYAIVLRGISTTTVASLYAPSASTTQNSFLTFLAVANTTNGGGAWSVASTPGSAFGVGFFLAGVALPTPSATATPTPSISGGASPTGTGTPSVTNTGSVTQTRTNTASNSGTPSQTQTPPVRADGAVVTLLDVTASPGNNLVSNTISGTVKLSMTATVWGAALVLPNPTYGFLVTSITVSGARLSGGGTQYFACELWGSDGALPTGSAALTAGAGVTSTSSSTGAYLTCPMPADAIIPQATSPGALPAYALVLRVIANSTTVTLNSLTSSSNVNYGMLNYASFATSTAGATGWSVAGSPGTGYGVGLLVKGVVLPSPSGIPTASSTPSPGSLPSATSSITPSPPATPSGTPSRSSTISATGTPSQTPSVSGTAPPGALVVILDTTSPPGNRLVNADISGNTQNTLGITSWGGGGGGGGSSTTTHMAILLESNPTIGYRLSNLTMSLNSGGVTLSTGGQIHVALWTSVGGYLATLVQRPTLAYPVPTSSMTGYFSFALASQNPPLIIPASTVTTTYALVITWSIQACPSSNTCSVTLRKLTTSASSTSYPHQLTFLGVSTFTAGSFITSDVPNYYAPSGLGALLNLPVFTAGIYLTGYQVLPSSSPTASSTLTPTLSGTPSSTASITNSPPSTPSQTPSSTSTPSVTPSFTPTPSQSPSPTYTPFFGLNLGNSGAAAAAAERSTQQLGAGLGVGLALLLLVVLWMWWARQSVIARRKAAAARRAGLPFSSAAPGFAPKAAGGAGLLGGLFGGGAAKKRPLGGGPLTAAPGGGPAAPGGGGPFGAASNPMRGPNTAAMAYAEAARAEAERAVAAAEMAEAQRREAAALRAELGEDDSEDEEAAAGEAPLPANVWTVAQWDYDPQADDELRFAAEAYVWLTGGDGCDGTEGWARGRVLEPRSGFGGKEGVLPVMYVRRVTEEELLAAGLRRLGPLDRPAAPRPPARPQRQQSMRVEFKGGGKGEMQEEEEKEEEVDESAPLPPGWKLRGLKGKGKSGRWYEHESGLVQHIRPQAKVVVVKKDDSDGDSD